MSINRDELDKAANEAEKAREILMEIGANEKLPESVRYAARETETHIIALIERIDRILDKN